MSITLDDRECAALKLALAYYVPQLRMQRVRAEVRDAQHALSLLETELEKISLRLAAMPEIAETLSG